MTAHPSDDSTPTSFLPASDAGIYQTSLHPFDVQSARQAFSSLAQTWSGRPAVFFDNPGGTQVPDQVIEAIARYYREQNANVGGAFPTSLRTNDVMAAGRRAVADLLNAPDPHTIVFGANMTSLTFPLARSIGDTIRPGDEIVVTNLDHDANVTPWLDLRAQGAVIRVVDFDPADCTLSLESFAEVLNERTRLVAVTHASNAVGTIPPVAEIVRMAHGVGALVFIDAVQYAPHCSIDVQALDCDFLACSAYKFFGPHVGILYGKAHLLESLPAHKVRPAKDSIPYRWETGTQNHEGVAGTTAAIDYLASLCPPSISSPDASRRERLVGAMTAIGEYERQLCNYLIAQLRTFDDIVIYGVTAPERSAERVPTLAFRWPRLSPRATAEHLAEHGIAVWSGNYYALRLMERLGLEEEGGAVRIGLAHYNTFQEIDRLIEAMRKI